MIMDFEDLKAIEFPKVINIYISTFMIFKSGEIILNTSSNILTTFSFPVKCKVSCNLIMFNNF